jgi:hypothetical protein
MMKELEPEVGAPDEEGGGEEVGGSVGVSLAGAVISTLGPFTLQQESWRRYITLQGGASNRLRRLNFSTSLLRKPILPSFTNSGHDIIDRSKLGRQSVLFGFWLAGYALGAFAWFARVPVIQFVENFGLSADAATGLLMGLMGSSVMVLSVLFWSLLSSS